MSRSSRYELTRLALAAVVVTTGCLATVSTAGAQPAPTESLSHTGLPSIVHGVSNPGTTSAQTPQVAVTTPSRPDTQQLAGDSLYQFIVHHATTHYVTTPTMHNLARWRGGMQSICPLTVGLDPGSNAFVTARIRTVAAYVGAPVQSQPCTESVQIRFTSNPRESMDAVMSWATTTATFGIRYTGGIRDLLAYKSDQPIQGWYITTRGGSRVLNTDVALVGLDVLPLWPQIEQKYLAGPALGSRVGGDSGSGIGIGAVILIVDTTRVTGYSIGTIADYLAMLTLSVVQSPDHCDPLPSILDLMSSSCATREKPAGITAGDLAFLKALYYRNTGLGPSLSRAAIQDNMARQFELHSP